MHRCTWTCKQQHSTSSSVAVLAQIQRQCCRLCRQFALALAVFVVLGAMQDIDWDNLETRTASVPLPACIVKDCDAKARDAVFEVTQCRVTSRGRHGWKQLCSSGPHKRSVYALKLMYDYMSGLVELPLVEDMRAARAARLAAGEASQRMRLSLLFFGSDKA